MGTVHPIVEEGFFGLALRIGFVAAPQREDRLGWIKFVRKIAAHLRLLRLFVAHDEHLTTMPLGSMGADEYTHNKL